MKFTLEVGLDNDAFGASQFSRAGEISRILSALAYKLASNPINVGDTGPVFDRNGNTVGTWKVGRSRSLR